MIRSIDQNCHVLWDAVPKCQALALAGHRVRQFVEDLDVAFTIVGGNESSPLVLERERFHPSGGADWGAALYYSEFLGRLPTDIADWEALTGVRTAALARQLDMSVQDLYRKYSPSDNWQLIGPSYVGDDHHRIIGDLTVAETASALRTCLERARQDMLRRFVDADAQAHARSWADQESARLEDLIARCSGGKLVELYRLWMGQSLGSDAEPALSSDLFDLRSGPAGLELIELFCREYESAAQIYNAAIAETHQRLRPLDIPAGELPAFATLTKDGHRVRTQLFFRDGELVASGRGFALGPDGRLPIDSLTAAGIECIVGKAILLVLQVRSGPTAQPLAVPYQGSLYMSAAHALDRKLRAAGLFKGPDAPLLRVRLHLLDRLAELNARIALPAHLAAAMGSEIVPAKDLAASWRSLRDDARKRLTAFADPAGRAAWQRQTLGEVFDRMEALDAQRRAQAAIDDKAPAIRQMSHEFRSLQTQVTAATVQQIDRDTQVSQVDYWDSRGAIMPWATCLGGPDFYRRVLAAAEIYEEDAESPQRQP